MIGIDVRSRWGERKIQVIKVALEPEFAGVLKKAKLDSQPACQSLLWLLGFLVFSLIY
jgi:hypothetical protein